MDDIQDNDYLEQLTYIQNNQSINFFCLPREIWSIILHKCDFEQWTDLRRVCIMFSELIKPRITRFKHLIGQKVLGIYVPTRIKNQDINVSAKHVRCTIKKNIPHWSSAPKPRYIYDRYYIKFYILITDGRPSLNNNDDILRNLRIIVFLSDNKRNEYSHHSNWRFREIPNECLKELGPGFKYLGENINNVYVYDNKLLDENNIDVGDIGGYDDGDEFNIIRLHFNTKTIKLGVKMDCYYPESIWNMI